jgi:prevent-host-death family protein
MTRYGHLLVMRTAKVSELKARLSAYLAEVRRGETVIVCDRSTPVARLSPLEETDDGVRIDEATRSSADLRKLKPVPVRRRVDVVRILRDSRDQR